MKTSTDSGIVRMIVLIGVPPDRVRAARRPGSVLGEIAVPGGDGFGREP
jgi:hypothetical protein